MCLRQRRTLWRLYPFAATFARLVWNAWALFHRKKDADVVQLFEWTGVDLITAYIFGTGNSTDFLRDQKSSLEWE
jgi:hypothetical protein